MNPPDLTQPVAEGTIIDGEIDLDQSSIGVMLDVGRGAPSLTADEHLGFIRAQMRAHTTKQALSGEIDLGEEAKGVRVKGILVPQQPRLRVPDGVYFRTLPLEIAQIQDAQQRRTAILLLLAGS